MKKKFLGLVLCVVAAQLYLSPLYPVYAKSPSPSGVDSKDGSPKFVELESRVAKFQDQAKADLVLKLNTSLNKLNSQKTQQMTAHLIRFSQKLSEIEAQISQAEQADSKFAGIKGDISTTKDLIQTTQNLINAQSDLDYTVVLGSEKTAFEDVKRTRDGLFSDMKKTSQAIMDVKKAILKVNDNFLGVLNNTNES